VWDPRDPTYDPMEAYYHDKAQLRMWEYEQEAKAVVVIALLLLHIPRDRLPMVAGVLSGGLGHDCFRDAFEVFALSRQHIPADRLPEVEDFLPRRSGYDSLRQAFDRDCQRIHLRKLVPHEHWQEIEDYLKPGCAFGRNLKRALGFPEGDWPPS
jgi:hypothetical protein